MQKAIRTILAVSSRVLLIGLTIQIGLGVLWMVTNLGSLQQFEKTSFCALMGEGIFLGVWQVMQVLVAFFAAFRMIRIFKNQHKGWGIWGALAVITVPMAMQCHLAVLPYSLTSSMILLELGGVVKHIRSKEKLTAHVLLTVLPFWVLASLLMPEYMVFGLVPVLVLFLHSVSGMGRGHRKQIVVNMWVILAFGGIIFALQSLQGQSIEKPQDGIRNALVSRVAWSNLREDYFNLWSEDMRAMIDYSTLLGGALYADGVEERLIPSIQEAAGENADAFLKYMVSMAWDAHGKAILKEMAWDGAGYVLSPSIHHMLLQRKGYDSYSGRNYDIMLQTTPYLTKYYVNYSCWWFGVAMVIAAVMQFLWICHKKQLHWLKQNGWILAVHSLMTGAMAVWYTLQGAGMFDYKNTITITSLWVVWIVIVTISSIEEKDYGSVDERKTA